MYRVFEGHEQPWPRVFGGCERLLYRLCGVRPDREQTWLEYAYALLAFSALTMVATYAIERLQHLAPFNPQSLPAVPPNWLSTPRPALPRIPIGNRMWAKP